MAGAILVVGSIAMLTLIVSAIATNNRNKMDSTQTMLAASILEQVNSTFNSTGTTSDLTDCAGNSWTINTTIPNTGTAGAALPALLFVLGWVRGRRGTLLRFGIGLHNVPRL